ncbi:NADH-quinone oxidoreductase subunit H [bioreactor metagenome]|uniref:NADH-quinone oxidoreductase subunit H n=1 Tax=bioreactor metagenome TaxID=1076179 RepID=A0A645ICE2_9ZZZZ
MKFALFFMGEYAAITTGAAMLVTLFLGGWTLPIAGLDQPAETILGGILHIGIFLAKMLFVVFMVIWVRWMWPRFRYDQLMDLGWRRFIPVALANIVLTAVVVWMLMK